MGRAFSAKERSDMFLPADWPAITGASPSLEARLLTQMTILATGCAGFIGSNFVHVWLRETGETIVNLDKLTYAGNLANLADVKDDPRHVFVRGDIADKDLVSGLLARHRPRGIVNFAAESHVDRSIRGPGEFIETNITGTFHLLEAARSYWSALAGADRETFCFLHVSTDEVYGSLARGEAPFRETDAYAPNSPYAASKAASDHLVRAWHRTYGLPVLTTHCSNNYGPYQFPEKLIPLVILNALAGKPLPVYGDGLQVRDWLHVEDHCRAIMRVLLSGAPGETYNIGGWSEKTNLDVVNAVCAALDDIRPRADRKRYAAQVTFVEDRPGHDRRYAIDATKIKRELGWVPEESFETGLRGTVAWYLANPAWVDGVTSGVYRQWVSQQYGF